MSNLKAGKPDAVFALVDNLARVNYADLPAEAVNTTKLDILDCLGVAVAATTTDLACRKIVDLVTEIGGREESTIIGDGRKVPAHAAAFANAALTHALNYDDYTDPLITHFGCVIFPAAFAMAERVGKVTGKEFITTYTLGVDLAARLSRALITKGEQRNWNLHGWLTTQLVGYFGAAAVAGRLQGLKADRLVHALGLAYSQVAGNKQVLVGVGADKGIYPSYPAHSGVLAALMAHKGIAGPQESLEGQNGLYNVFFQGLYDPAALTRDLGRSFEGSAFYIYPCCGFTHSRIELVLKMIEEHKFRPDDIESITVFVGPISRLLCEPQEVRRNPRLTAEAQYSLPFTVATAIAKGKPRIGHFTGEGIRDPEILSVSNKVGYRIDDAYDLKYGTGYCPAKMEIKLKNGRTLCGEQGGGRYGHPERPVSKADLKEKFRECVAYSARPLSVAAVDKIVAMVDNLEDVDDVSQIIRLVS